MCDEQIIMCNQYKVIMLGLFCFQAEVDKNIELLRKKDEELSSALEKMENQSENNDIDEVIIPTAPLYKQIDPLCPFQLSNNITAATNRTGKEE